MSWYGCLLKVHRTQAETVMDGANLVFKPLDSDHFAQSYHHPMARKTFSERNRSPDHRLMGANSNYKYTLIDLSVVFHHFENSLSYPKSIKDISKMPGRLQDFGYSRIAVRKLHPTFGAEISGIDFSQPVDNETFHEVLQAISQVSHSIVCHSALMADSTSMASASFVLRSSAMKHM